MRSDLMESDVGAIGARPWLRLLPAITGIVVIVVGLLSRGGNSAAAAAAFSAALLIVAAIACLAATRRDFQRAFEENRIPLLALVGFVGWSLATTYPMAGPLAHPIWAAMGFSAGSVSLAPYRVYEGLAAFAAPVCAYLIGALAVAQAPDRDRLGRILIIAGLSFCLIAFGHHLATLGASGKRLDAGLGSANAAATAFGLFALIGAAMALRAARRRRRGGGRIAGWLAALTRTPFALALVVLCAAGLFLTASRGGALAAGAALILLLGMSMISLSGAALGPRFAAAGKAALAVALLALIVASFGAQVTLERFAGLSDSGDEGRVLLLQTHWRAFLDRPILGHGLNAFHEINALYSTPESWSATRSAGATHNIVLQALEESGLIGFGLLTLALAAPLARGVAAAASSASGQAWAAAAVAGFALVLLHGMVDFGLNVPAIASLFAFVLAAFTRRRVPST